MRILWLKTELLHPLDRGARIRTHAMLKALKRHHQITYAALDDGTTTAKALEQASEYSHEVIRLKYPSLQRRSPKFLAGVARNLLSSLPFTMWRFRSDAMRAYVMRAARERQHDVIVCDFLFPAINVPEPLGVPSVLFEHNVEAMIWKRHAEVAGNPAARAYYRSQWKKLARYERDACRRFDQVAAVSVEDRDLIRQQYGVTRVADVPTGVDTDFFRASGKVKAQPHNIVFMGAMDWLPNEDAVAYFLDTVFPAVRAEHPGATFTVVGRNPSAALLARAKTEPALRVTGTVPDVRPHLEAGAVFVVPLRVGGGTRLKIFEAMGMDLPVVSTTIGAEGLPLEPGRDLLIADTPADLATAINGLLADRAAAVALGRRGGDRVRAEFGWDRAAHIFAEICEAAIAHRRSASARPSLASSHS